MWLLNTATAEPREFDVRSSELHDAGGYSILSHVWGKDEATFQHVQGLADLSVYERWSRVSLKVRNCCSYASDLGFRWVWIDTCCINKSSSAKLSEAINSMYEWYSLAALCIAFLVDVPDGSDPGAKDSPFRHTKWFQRGWTLQELIAPRSLIFVSRVW